MLESYLEAWELILERPSQILRLLGQPFLCLCSLFFESDSFEPNPLNPPLQEVNLFLLHFVSALVQFFKRFHNPDDSSIRNAIAEYFHQRIRKATKTFSSSKTVSCLWATICLMRTILGRIFSTSFIVDIPKYSTSVSLCFGCDMYFAQMSSSMCTAVSHFWA